MRFMVIIMLGLFSVFGASLAMADDFSDGVAETSDEPIAADDAMGSKDTNISFVVQEAISKAKAKSSKKEDMKESDGKESSANKDQVNYNDGQGDKNENSIVLEPGAQADKIYNIVIEK